MALAGLVLSTTGNSAVAQEWPFPRCPAELVISPFSASESPTRAALAQDWFLRLQTVVPAVRTPVEMMALAPNDPVTVCRVAFAGTATQGLGANADVAVLVVSKSGSEVVARVESKAFQLYLPLSHTADIGLVPVPVVERGLQWPVSVLAVTAPNDREVLEVLLANTLASSNEILAFRPWFPDQPGLQRVERLVFGDRCGVVSFFVRLKDGKLKPFEGDKPVVEPASCGSGSIRSLLLAEPVVAVQGTSLVLRSNGVEVALSRSNNLIVPLTVAAYKGSDGKSSVATPVVIDGGPSLRGFGAPTTCSFGTWIAFSESLFVIDRAQIGTLRGCPNKTRTLTPYVLLTNNGSGTGSLRRKANTVTPRFVDGAVATLRVAKR